MRSWGVTIAILSFRMLVLHITSIRCNFFVLPSVSATFHIFDSLITWVIALLSLSLDLIAGLRNASTVALISADSPRVRWLGMNHAGNGSVLNYVVFQLYLWVSRHVLYPGTAQFTAGLSTLLMHACMLVIKRMGKKMRSGTSQVTIALS